MKWDELKASWQRKRKHNRWTRRRWDWMLHLLWLFPAGAVAMMFVV